MPDSKPGSREKNRNCSSATDHINNNKHIHNNHSNNNSDINNNAYVEENLVQNTQSFRRNTQTFDAENGDTERTQLKHRL